MSMEEQELREQIGEAQQKLAGLEVDLRAVDDELESMATQREQYELLERACGSLEELDRLGAAELFWGTAGEVQRAAAHVEQVRQRVDVFSSRIAGIEQRRQDVLNRIQAENDGLDELGEDLYDFLEEEESRKSEWAIEREETPLPYREQIMPWVRGLEEDRRYRVSFAGSVATALLLGLIFQMIELPIPERSDLIEVPERVAKLIRELPKPTPPVPVAEPKPEEPEAQPQPEPEPEPKLVQEKPPEPVPVVADEPAPQQQAQQENAREQAQTKGILAFRDSFANRAQSKPSAQLGSQARLGNAGDSAVGLPERSMVTTTAPGSSGGINLASISRNVGGGGGGGIAGVQVSQVASSIGSGGGGNGDRPLAGGGQGAGRTDEEIQIIFDRHKAALYRLYNRELRNDPTLRGQLVVRLTIEPDGSVSLCRLVSSDMNAPVLAEQVIDRIRGFDFGAKEGIVSVTIVYPIDFLPAA